MSEHGKISISSTFSLQSPLGLQFLNSNKAAEMAQILNEYHKKYVPTTTVHGGDKDEILDHVIFDGDQLTEERAKKCTVGKFRSCYRHRSNGWNYHFFC